MKYLMIQMPQISIFLLSLAALIFFIIPILNGVKASWPITDSNIKKSFIRLKWIIFLLAFSVVISALSYWYAKNLEQKESIELARKSFQVVYSDNTEWHEPDEYLLETDRNSRLIKYGRQLIARTQDYFGKNGSISQNAINGLSCQNCHLDAGTKPYGNNYFAVASTYPKVRPRSGKMTSISSRINGCFMRSLNGKALDTTSLEMQAMVAYMNFLGTDIPKGKKPKGSGIAKPTFLDRACDPSKGKMVFEQKCISCHGQDGQGMKIPGSERDYPPLWGRYSYNEAAGLFRISNFAGYVKSNMPFGASHSNPQLTDEEAWDVAAFVNSQERPKHPFLDKDWPDISKKPFDHPFGPYKDPYSETIHKYGPYQQIIDYYNKDKK